jgi:PhnB protein
MSVHTTAHINFRGGARKALEFYQSVFGGDLSIATYADIQAVEQPSQIDQVAFGRLTASSGFDIMAYDVQPSKPFDRGEKRLLCHAPGVRRRGDQGPLERSR